MTYEWTKVELYGANNDGDARRFTIADGISVSKGSLLYLVDARAVSHAALANAPVAGVAAEEHLAGEGITSITVWTNGIFEVTTSAACTYGAPLSADTKTKNTVTPCLVGGTTGCSGAQIVGYSLETGAADEIINVRLRL